MENTCGFLYPEGVHRRQRHPVLRDERAVLPVAAHSSAHQVTLSLSSVLGAGGVQQMHEPPMTPEEHRALVESAEVLREAAERALSVGTSRAVPPADRGAFR
ncbi:hypothetical protein [Streptomyces sp. NPDC093261]|uniref:hypothetical protein n=1 Tax=Streptomyces sp. NPDC093261 TaxID=3366037 RepID=UPI003824EA05